MSAILDDKLNVEQLLLTVKQLSPAELQEFTRQFWVWLDLFHPLLFSSQHRDENSYNRNCEQNLLRNGVQVSQSDIPDHGTEEEAALLACISENSHLPATEQRRYERLRRKCENRTLTERELAEYQSLLQQLEARNVKRIEALIALAQRRGMTLQTIMAELGLKGDDNAF